jgi:hypothetical protein
MLYTTKINIVYKERRSNCYHLFLRIINHANTVGQERMLLTAQAGKLLAK